MMSLAAILLGMLGACLAGCSGSGTVYGVPFTRQDISRHEPPATHVRASEAYWWREGDAVHAVLRWRSPSLADGAFARSFQFSLMLDGMPAGRERLYQLDRDSVRVRSSDRGLHRRAASIMGAAVLVAPKQDVLKGRFHVVMRQQQFTVLTGWVPPLSRGKLVIMTGEFEAVHAPERGRAVREQVEADGFSRTPEIWRIPPGAIEWLDSSPPASAPTTQPQDAKPS